MRTAGLISVALLSASFMASGCTETDSPVKNALESSKDALDIRENENLKDAVEDMSDVAKDAAESIKDAAQ